MIDTLFVTGKWWSFGYFGSTMTLGVISAVFMGSEYIQWGTGIASMASAFLAVTIGLRKWRKMIVEEELILLNRISDLEDKVARLELDSELKDKVN